MAIPNQLGLFGQEPAPIEEKTRDSEYSEYIHSARWKTLRAQALARAKDRCEVCGFSKWSVQLEVHHKTYERFKHERLDDLLVVCVSCHKEQDEIRKRETDNRNHQTLLDARFHGWASKVYGEQWDCMDVDRIYEEFLEWLERKAWN